jgi:hypothetical protein
MVKLSNINSHDKAGTAVTQSSILDHKKLVIFGSPRSGTKLLASILASFGYHAFGEFFDTRTSSLENGKISRMTPADIIYYRNQTRERPLLEDYKHTVKILDRLRRWRQLSNIQTRWAVTVWPDNIFQIPSIMLDLQGCKWLCVQRNPWDQLVSYLVVRSNANPDGQHDSEPVVVDYNTMHKVYWRMQSTILIQEDLISRGIGIRIQFDELVSGIYPGFSKPYRVETVDQHADPSLLIENLDEVKEWYHSAEYRRKT